MTLFRIWAQAPEIRNGLVPALGGFEAALVFAL